MHKNSRVLLIQDVRSFCLLMISQCREGLMSRYNISSIDNIDLFIDWSIDDLLTNHFNLKVVGHYRNDEFKCMLTEIHHEALVTLSGSMNLRDLDLIKGCEIKTMVTGYDLFITPRTTNRYYL